MLENIVENKYLSAVNSYTALDMSSRKITGSLIEKKDKQLVIDIGDSKAMQIELIKDVSINKGDMALIDRRNIARSKVVDIGIYEEVNNEEKNIYARKLKSLGIDVSEENIKIIRRLDGAGIVITKDNFETYKLARTSLENISSSLDYEGAVRLVEMGIDLENESIEKIDSLVSELEEEKEGFNILKMFKKSELTTEDAEQIAEEIYGSKMGKDIIDIIKSLHKEKVSITKKNIEKINDVFYKLHNLKEVEDKTFIDTIKNQLDINIDNLYKVKRYVKNRERNIEVDLKNLRQILKLESYETNKTMEVKVTSKDLENLEEDIRKFIADLDLQASRENINMTKEFIKRNMDISKENILSLSEMKEALKVIVENLDKEIAAQLINRNIDIETADIRKIAEEIEGIKNTDSSLAEDLNIDKITKDTEEIISKINNLETIDEKDIITLLERNVDFKISKIEQVILNKDQVLSSNTNTLNSIDNISTAFKEIGKLNFNTIAFQMKENIPMTIINIRDNQEVLQRSIDYKEYGIEEIEQALAKNDLDVLRLNIKKSMEAFRNYNYIKENLTSNMVKQAVAENIEIENVELDIASRYVQDYRRTKGYTFVDNALEMVKSGDENIMFLMKNNRPLTFKELSETNSMFKNENQIGHKISEMSDLVDEHGDNETKEQFQRFKENIRDISKSMNGSKEDVEEAYRRMEESIKDMEENVKFLNKDYNNLMKEKSREISENIDEHRTLAKENKIIQLPLYMNGQFTNLNMYFREKQKETSKQNNEEISVALSIDTVNMGNLNINLDIRKKNVSVKIALEDTQDKKHIEGHKNILIDFLEQDGYIIDEISFHDEGEIGLLAIEDENEERASLFNSNLDVKI